VSRRPADIENLVDRQESRFCASIGPGVQITTNRGRSAADPGSDPKNLETGSCLNLGPMPAERDADREI